MAFAMKPLAVCLAIVATLCAASAAFGQSSPSETDITRYLSRGVPTLGATPAPNGPKPNTMSVSVAPSSQRKRGPNRTPLHPTNTPMAAAPPTAARPSVSLGSIQFAFNSAELEPTSVETLTNLGNALNHGLKDQAHFLIEGHTDAVGTETYNLELSQRRADAVKDYLVGKLGVAAGRLRTVGRGATDPADPVHPNSPENRRVVVVNLSRQ
jgi:outer membrane protein OmpA-like peptidoglycan-associated protein